MLQYGPSVEVTAPAEVREHIKGEVAKMTIKYSSYEREGTLTLYRFSGIIHQFVHPQLNQTYVPVTCLDTSACYSWASGRWGR
ncbi:hypothetical protein [Alicyclobacillus sp. SO9]|uniref:hypothetical protein n=1 Tax=Alicyclobacillus sp. SO9 TaxID=2665646 RepID=UPI00351C7C23